MDSLKELRSKSGAPIAECKKALLETDNNLSSAMDWLRHHGVHKAKLSGRDATEGLVGVLVSPNQQSACIVKLSSETDFAGRSEAFVNLMMHTCHAVLNNSSSGGELDKQTLLQSTHDGKTVQSMLDEAVLSIRENLSVASATRLQANTNNNGGLCVSYVHGRVDNSNIAGTAAAIVHVAPADSNKAVSTDVLQDVGKKLAMHIVAAKPQYLSPEDVPEAVLEKERDILKQQLADSGKPDDILDKIVSGKMRKFYEGVCLTEQAHMVEEGNPKVSKVLDGLGIVVTQFASQSVS